MGIARREALSARRITAGSRALTVLSFTKGCEQEKRLLVAGRFGTAVERQRLLIWILFPGCFGIRSMIGMIIGRETGIIRSGRSAIAGIAQLAEQRIRNAWVGGSNPLSGTIFKKVLNQSPRP